MNINYHVFIQVDYILQDDGRSCSLKPPCERIDNGGCDHICTAIDPRHGSEGVKCSCRKHYKLNANGNTCDEGKVWAFHLRWEHLVFLFVFLCARVLSYVYGLCVWGIVWDVCVLQSHYPLMQVFCQQDVQDILFTLRNTHHPWVRHGWWIQNNLHYRSHLSRVARNIRSRDYALLSAKNLH